MITLESLFPGLSGAALDVVLGKPIPRPVPERPIVGAFVASYDPRAPFEGVHPSAWQPLGGER